jgi:thiopurine S-methyltransferase
MEPAFWHARWQENRIGFHLPEANPLLIRYWPVIQVAPGSDVLVPLCGKSLDMLWLLDQGYRVTGVEISRIAVEAFFEENRLEPVIVQTEGFTRYRCDELVILCGDFFALQRQTTGFITAVYDRASLIALPPAMRTVYAAHLASLLDAGTPCLLITLDYDQQQMNGPPFAVSAEEITALYADSFGIERLGSDDVLEDSSRFLEAGIKRLHETTWRLQRSQTGG